MNGDRFKNRLPKFLGKISDFEDLLIAEDKEFDRIDRDISRFDKGLFINSLNDIDNPDEFLKRLEKDYGLPGIGTYKERINAILVKRRAKEPTTPFRVEELGNYYSDVDDIVNFIPQYDEYSFIVEFLRSRGETDIQGFINALEEIKPAHLKLLIKLVLEQNLYIGQVIRNRITKTYTLFRPDRIDMSSELVTSIISLQKKISVVKLASTNLMKDKYGDLDYYNSDLKWR